MIKKYENKNFANYVTIKNKSSVKLQGVVPGKRKKIKVDKNGIPLDHYWRRRLEDSKIDGCVEIVSEKNETIGQPEKNKEN